jgi:F-type H+-transporting ATPase subunit b
MESLLHTFGIDWRLLFVQGVNFIVLVGLLTWLLYKPVLKIVREREAVIAKGVEDAERAGEKLAHADQAALAIVKKGEDEAERLVAHGREEANIEKARIVKEAEVRAQATRTDAEARAKEHATRTLRESEKEIARLAVLAAEKIIREKA